MSEIIIPPLGYDYIFPNPRYATDEGLVAYGGDLNPNRILLAYSKGIFPWFNEGDPILWWSPNPRAILYPKDFKISKSFARTLRNKQYEVKFDCNFEKVVKLCATVPRKGQVGTWIVESMQKSYNIIHQKGFAHSVEVYFDGTLAGGLYGVSLGAAFFGESMFSLQKDASKIALYELSQFCQKNGFDFIDCQIPTKHLLSLGAIKISRDKFLDILEASNQKPTLDGNWGKL